MLSSLALSLVLSSKAADITFVQTPTTNATNRSYRSNKQPLAPTPLIKLPLGSVEAHGWLREYLKRQRTGMTGNMPKISQWLKRDGNAWLNKDGSGKAGWEEVPYWLKGYISLAYQLKDKAMIVEANSWIEAAFASQRPDGDFGPNQKMDDGSRDFWGNMLMLECLRSYYEVTQDKRVVDLMTNYFHFQLELPDKAFLTGYWQKARGADNMASVFWLYNITGDEKLLELAEKCHRQTMNWSQKDTLPDWHNVNVAQSFDEPGIYYQLTKDPANLRQAYNNFDTIRRLYGQVPGGMFGADENARKGQSDPRQAVETCGMVEQMLSDEELLAISGDTKWADHCEEVAFNTYPAAVTPEFTALRYLTSPNMATSDHFNHAPGFQNSGAMTMFNPLSHRCCQHNHSHGWPYFSENLWMASNDNGLVASLYSASKVTAKVGNGSSVSITEESNYPFEEQIRLSISTGKSAVKFPLYLRLPAWCAKPTLTVNGEKIKVTGKPGDYVRIDRSWKTGDRVSLGLPMALSTKFWKENQNSVSVNYGPLTFSLKLQEQIVKMDSTKTALHDSEWQKTLDTSKWPGFEYTSKSAWNYGLNLNPANPTAQFKVVRKAWPKSNFPFTLGEVPISIMAKGSLIPQWQIDRTGLVAKLQASPTVTKKPVETIELVPMGAARLRISAFPWIGKNGKAWTEAPKGAPYQAAASHTFGGDTIDALLDNIVPKASNDEEVPRFTWWDHKGTSEWVEYKFKAPMTVKGVDVYWFDDTGKGECRVPESWSILGLVDGKWVPIQPNAEPTVYTDAFNRVNFADVKVAGLRLQVKLQPRFSGGILEWRVR